MYRESNVGCAGMLVILFVFIALISCNILATEYSVEYWIDYSKEVPLGTTDVSKWPCAIGLFSGPLAYGSAFVTYIHKNFIYEKPVFKGE